MSDKQPLGPLQRDWIAKLRSGDYAQTQGFLHDESGYCCLGVALEHVIGVQPEAQSEGHWIYSLQASDGRNVAMSDTLSDSCAATLGLRSGDAIIEKEMIPVDEASNLWIRMSLGDCQTVSLAEMNDYGLTFQEIADFIEANPEAVFKEPR